MDADKKCSISSDSFDVKETNEILYLMDIYLSEWCHRDALLWKQIYTFFFAGLIVSILPFTSIWNVDFSQSIPKWIFPTVGILIAIFFFIISNAYAVRLTAIGKTYSNIMEKLPSDLRRIKITELSDKKIYKILNYPMVKMVSYSMSFALLALSVMMLILCVID